MIDFGSSIGISLDDLSSDELQDRLDQIAAAWNDLPIHERQRLDPPKDNLSGRSRAMAAYQTDDDIAALIKSFRYEMPQGELPSPAEIAPIIRETGLLNQIHALAHWIQPRAEVTATGVLRPAAARQAFEDLGLVAWWREWLRCDYVDRSSSEDIEVALESIVSRQSWRSARDCIPLDRLWSAAVACQVINIEGRWAYSSWPQELDDDGTVTLALRAGLDVLVSYLDGDIPFAMPVASYALLRSYVRRPRSVPLDEIEEFVLSWVLTPSQRADADFNDLYRHMIRSTTRYALYRLDDLGIFSQQDNEIALTAWGDVYVANWLAFELGEPSVEA